MKTQHDSVIVTMTTHFKFWDRVKILFGGKFHIRVQTPVTYDMKRGIRVSKSEVRDFVSFREAAKRKELAHEA